MCNDCVTSELEFEVAIKASLLQRANNFLRRLVGRRQPAPIDNPNSELMAERIAQTQRVFRDNADRAVNRLMATGNVREFINDMRVELRVMHLQAQTIGAGGPANLTRESRQRYNRIVAEQDAYLRGFERDLNRMKNNLTETEFAEAGKRIKQRANLYAEPAAATQEIETTAAAGIPMLPFYPKVRTDCKMNCKCRWRFVKVEGGWDCYWELSPVENCDTCLARRRVAYPLRVRNGVIQPFNQNGVFSRRG